MQIQSTFGFVSPYNSYYYGAGLDKNFQIQLPFSASLDVDIENKKLQASFRPLSNQKSQSEDINIVHYSTWPYTTQRSVLTIEPHSDSKNTEYIYVRRPNRVNIIAIRLY